MSMEIILPHDQFSKVLGDQRGTGETSTGEAAPTIDVLPEETLTSPKRIGPLEAAIVGGELHGLRFPVPAAHNQIFLWQLESGAFSVRTHSNETPALGKFIGHFVLPQMSSEPLIYNPAPVLCGMCGSTTRTRCGRPGCA